MSSICGIARSDGAPVAAAEIATMLDALDHWRADARDQWIGSGAGLGHLLLRTTLPSQHEHLPAHDATHQLALTGDVRLDNRGELADRLGIAPGDLPGWSDGRLALGAYREWGEACPPHLVGDFAFAVWDGQRRRLFCARDRFGVKPFYYAHGGAWMAFATEMKGLLALPFVDRSINETWVGDFLHRLTLDRAHTLYAGITRLVPAHALTFDAHGLRVWRYWELDRRRELRLARDEDYIEAFREKLVLAIRRRVDTPCDVGSELSGGLDSSAICAIAQPLLRDTGRELYAFAQVRPDGVVSAEPVPEDARGAVDLVCRHAGIRRLSLLTGDGEGILPALAWGGRHCDEPPQHMMGLYNDRLYETAAAQGVRVLLSGFGGNQGVSADASGYLRELLRAGRWIELGRLLSARRDPRHPIIGALALALSAFAPMALPIVGAIARRNPAWRKYPYRAARDDFNRRLGMRRRTFRSMRPPSGRLGLRDEVARLLDLPIVASRLESAHLSTAARRIEYRYPLLDVDLLSTYLAMPSRLKYAPGLPRHLFRASLGGWLPDEARWTLCKPASANPGATLRKRRDAEALLARLQAVPADSPLFRYVDAGKLKASLVLTMSRPRMWGRETELIGALLLEEILRRVAPPARA